MFTGIVQALGVIEQSVENSEGDRKLLIISKHLDFSDIIVGDSICCNGVCLTATEITQAQHGSGFWADVSSETLGCTTLGSLGSGDSLNLEKSLTPTSALGGHLVSGHVDGVGVIQRLEQDAQSWRFDVSLPEDLARYVAAKGSVCIDGTSLTVNSVQGAEFSVNIIPHTFENTVFSGYQIGSEVNIEIDLIARYVERLITYTKA